jgi:hypothetical protein
MHMRKSLLLALVACSAMLAACDGGDDDPAVTAQVPASASQSTGGFIAYLKQLVAVSPDDTAPVDVSSVTPPTSDFEAPVAIN